jgi:hypothetical protein
MTAECRTSAMLDGRHDLELTKAEMTRLSATPSLPMGTEDIRDL